MSIEAIKQALKKAQRAHDEVLDELPKAALDSLDGVINGLEELVAGYEKQEPQVHAISAMTADELWLSNGKLRAELADLKAERMQQKTADLSVKQRVYLAQAWVMLEDYASDQRGIGNDSFADGALASAHEIKAILAA